MKRRKVKLTTVSGPKCPYCGTVYRHENMARNCLRGPLCKVYNLVTGDRRTIADIQFKASACVQFMAAPLLSSTYKDISQHAQRCLDLIDRLYTETKALKCGIAVFDAAVHPAAHLLESIWPPVRTDVTHLIAVISTVLADVRFALRELWDRYPKWNTDAVWAEIEKETDALFEQFNPDGGENYPHLDKVEPAYDSLYKFIFPEASRPELRLYLAGERLWIAAHSKAEAREVLRKGTGLVGLTMKGIALGEKLEDGRTAADLLATAQGVAGIVARAE